MYRRIFLITLVLVSIIAVYNLTRPSNKPPLDLQKELETTQTTQTMEQQTQKGQVIPETNDTVAELSIKDKMVMIENEVVSAKTELAASNSQQDRLEIEIFVNAAEDILNIQNFSKQDCPKYESDFKLKYHPNDEEPLSEGTEKAFRMLEELCN